MRPLQGTAQLAQSLQVILVGVGILRPMQQRAASPVVERRRGPTTFKPPIHLGVRSQTPPRVVAIRQVLTTAPAEYFRAASPALRGRPPAASQRQDRAGDDARPTLLSSKPRGNFSDMPEANGRTSKVAAEAAKDPCREIAYGIESADA